MPVSYYVPLQCVMEKASGKTFTITLGFVPGLSIKWNIV